MGFRLRKASHAALSVYEPPYLRRQNPRLDFRFFIRMLPGQRDICTTDPVLEKGERSK